MVRPFASASFYMVVKVTAASQASDNHRRQAPRLKSRQCFKTANEHVKQARSMGCSAP